MWYACSSHIAPEVTPICTLRFEDRELLWKHIEANHIHYALISRQYDVFKDGSLQYTVDLGATPLKKKKTIGVVIGLTIILVFAALLIAFALRFIV